MKRFLVFLLPILVSACTTPRQDCINDATREYRVLSALIFEAEQNIARGYAVHRQSVPFNYAGSCYNEYIGSYSCMKSSTRVQETPVAINVKEERRTLSDLRARLLVAKSRSEMAVTQCQAQFSE